MRCFTIQSTPQRITYHHYHLLYRLYWCVGGRILFSSPPHIETSKTYPPVNKTLPTVPLPDPKLNRPDICQTQAKSKSEPSVNAKINYPCLFPKLPNQLKSHRCYKNWNLVRQKHFQTNSCVCNANKWTPWQHYNCTLPASPFWSTCKLQCSLLFRHPDLQPCSKLMDVLPIGF